MRGLNRPLIFLLFFVSGFCGLLYQVVWTRLAFASFGITTPVFSVVISVFMLGLSLGSWAGGKGVGLLVSRTRWSAAVFYAIAELAIGIGAFAVPYLFGMGEHLLLLVGEAGSLRYLFFSAVALALSILPWCIFMGTTFPFMMAYVREQEPGNAESFSYLYLANVLGAMSGTLLTAFVLVEALGFRHTLWVAAVGNFVIAALSLRLGMQSPVRESLPRSNEPAAGEGSRREETQAGASSETRLQPETGALAWLLAIRQRGRLMAWLLFATGFASMAMEVVWIRSFGPVLKTQVYSFALVVAAYLGATFLGSLLYRSHLRKSCPRPTAELIGLLCATVLLPILLNDPRLVKANWQWDADPLSVVILLVSISPFCAILGYLTPRLIDDYAGGDPAKAGRAYAVNVLGCILGPLFASYLLLPRIGERYALLLLGLPFLVFYFLMRDTARRKVNWGMGLSVAVLLIWALFFATNYEDHLLKTEKRTAVRRDYAASVISFGESREKHLLVNGVGMTSLTPVTKFMVHLPLALHQGRPTSALIICFGMGTSYRSALSWDLPTTAVELVPSVVDAFDFYHPDASRVRQNPQGRIVIDDGRRFLKRTQEKFDVIVVDPPPPPEAAGSSLLYSEQFYELIKQHLKPNGILQAWLPGGDPALAFAVLRSIRQAFPHIRCFGSVESLGTHVLASMDPIPLRTAHEMAGRLPAKAARDLMEWSSAPNAAAYFEEVISQESSIDRALHPDPSIRITDDQPYNEYYLLRKWDLY
jgi:spermidine synthase